ncbi:hypothetical protein LINPERHAP1_LOCUS17090 [Linum perenne]
MRVRVRLDIRKPLKREKKIRVEGGESFTCAFRYERLPNFCYICGKLGHIDRYCEVIFQVPEDQIVRMWDEQLRAPPRKSRTNAGNKYLVKKELTWGTDGPNLSRNGGRSTDKNWRSGGDVKQTMPRCIESLMGNLGASPLTKGMVIPYGAAAVSGDDEPINIHDDKKRRRGGSNADAMDEDVGGSGKPSKSPKKGSQDPKNLEQAGLNGLRTCQQP